MLSTKSTFFNDSEAWKAMICKPYSQSVSQSVVQYNDKNARNHDAVDKIIVFSMLSGVPKWA